MIIRIWLMVERKDTNGGMEIQNNMKLEISCIE